MHQLIRRQLDGVIACVAHSTRADGDLSPSTVEPAVLADRRHAAVDATWHAVHQVHIDRVVAVTASSVARERPRADALIADQVGLAVAVHSGDCVPIGFVHDGGVIAAAHAGWKGLEAGVLESTVRALRNRAGAGQVVAAVGPHIHPECYEFGSQDLARLVHRFGSDVATVTAAGTPALDLTTAIANELGRLGISVAASSLDCTACSSDRYWSHRARSEAGRIALVAWLEESR